MNTSSAGRLVRLLHFLGLVLLGGLIGGAAALVAMGFVAGVLWLNDLLWISPDSRHHAASSTHLVIATLAIPTLGGLLVGQLHRLLPERRAQGPSDVIAAVQTRRGRLPVSASGLSALSALMALGTGASVGQYGPLVHLGSALGSLAARLLRLSRVEDNIGIACGVAAAIAATFHAPLAGIVFAHEVVLRHYALRAFAPTAAAAIVAHVLANSLQASGPLLRVGETAMPHAWEYAAFLLLGGLGALVAGAYMSAILAVERQASRLPVPVSLRPALAGAMLGVTALWVPQILGIGQETLRLATVAGAYALDELALLLVLKLAATALCLGLGFSGGVFSPALLIGTLYGAVYGHLVLMLAGAGHETFVFYAVCGMLAVTAPVIGAPLASLLIVFELTGNYALTTAALASVTLASPISAQLFGRSLFDTQLARRGLDLSAGRSRALLKQARVDVHLTRDCVILTPATSVAAAVRQICHANHAEAQLVDAEGRHRGSVTLASLEAAREDGHGEAPVADFISPARPTLAPDDSLWDAMAALEHFSGEALAMVDRKSDDAFLGVVYEDSIARAFMRSSDEVRDEENSHG
ncbi:chloride channel protein [Onishia taeanensis]